MSNPPSQILVRQPQTDAEIDAFHEVEILAFSSEPRPDLAAAVRRDRENDARNPDFDPRCRRVAIRDASVVGAYVLFDRWLRVGSSYLSTGCIGGVATHPNHRNLGIGSAMMRDAIVEAEVRQHAILLLQGIANYYQRFGYADVVDHTDQVVERTAVPTEDPAGIAVRSATEADGPALLALRERHYSSYTGCFTRTLEQQEARLRRSVDNHNPPFLAVDADGNARGYLILRQGSSLSRATEVATDMWPAAAALLRHQSQLLAGQGDTTTDITWPLPPDSPTVYQLADNLNVPDTSSFGFSPRGWSVRSQTYMHRNAGWMGRAVSVRRLLESLRPVWHSRLSRASLAWSGPFLLNVGDESVAVEVGDEGAEVLEISPADIPTVTIAPERFVQLVFGYRPVTYVASLRGSSIPRELERVLEVLFPVGHAWIPGTDGF